MKQIHGIYTKYIRKKKKSRPRQTYINFVHYSCMECIAPASWHQQISIRRTATKSTQILALEYPQ
uniref:Uncharacterized protein n=1 Tax=Setaria italica TaxID=4555 RepID=K3ZYV0_SETIT